MTDAKGRWDELPALTRRLIFRFGRQIHGALPEPRSEFLAYHQHQPNVVKERDMTIIITDEDVKRLLPMRDCIEAMRVAFSDLANGAAVNRPRVRYLARHPDPERKYLANVHVGAVPSYGIACVRAGSQVIRPPSAGNDRRLYEYPQAFNWGVVILYSIETAEPLADARIPTLWYAGRRHNGRGDRSDRACGRHDAWLVRNRQAGALCAGGHPTRASDQSRQCLQSECRASRCLCP